MDESLTAFRISIINKKKMEVQLIEFVKQNRFLFDKTNKNYKNKNLRDQKFEELSKSLNIPAQKLKARWRTLRDKFYKDIKMKPSVSNAESPHKKWKWLDSLMFLKDTGTENLNTHSSCEKLMETLDDLFLREFSETQTTPKVTKSKTPPPIRHNRLLERNLENASHDFKRVDNLAEHVPVRGGNKSGIHLFFEGLAVQVDEANLTTIELSELQLKISQTYHEFLKTRIV